MIPRMRSASVRFALKEVLAVSALDQAPCGLGHTRCGAVNAAVKATCNPGLDVAPGCGHLAPIVEAIGRAVDGDDALVIRNLVY